MSRRETSNPARLNKFLDTCFNNRRNSYRRNKAHGFDLPRRCKKNKVSTLLFAISMVVPFEKSELKPIPHEGLPFRN